MTVSSSSAAPVPIKWAGLRNVVSDRTRVAAHDPLASGLFGLAGQGGCGMPTASGDAREAAALIAERVTVREPGIDLSPFRLERFAPGGGAHAGSDAACSR